MEPIVRTAAPTLLDTRGRACPIPVVLLGKAAREGAPGDRIELLATDAGSVASAVRTSGGLPASTIACSSVSTGPVTVTTPFIPAAA